jgi:hypothetical protein
MLERRLAERGQRLDEAAGFPGRQRLGERANDDGKASSIVGAK